MDTEILVAGAGLAGVLTAWHFGREHDVLLIDAEVPGAGASGLAAGLVNPIMALRARPVWHYEQAMAHLKQWIHDARLEDCIQTNEVFRPANDERQSTFFLQSANRYPDKCTWLSTEASAEYSPLVHAPHGGLIVRDGFALDVPASIACTVALYEANGGGLLTESRLTRWEETENEVVAFVEQNDREHRITCQKLVLALGAGYEAFEALRRLNLHNIKGELITLSTDSPLQLPALAGQGYLVPQRNRYVVGSTYVHTFTDLNPDPVRIRALQDKATQMVPQLKDATLEATWVGVRVTVPKIRLPLVGLLPGSSRVTIFSGLGAKGLLLAPLLAHRLAAGTPITGARVE